MSDEAPKIVHDTHTIIAVNEAALQLFRADAVELVDQPLTGGISGDDMQYLTRLRLKTIREIGEMPAQDLPFVRQDNSIFWARVKTTKRDDGLYESVLTYLYDY